MSSVQQELLCKASQYGIRFGFTVPIHEGRGPIAALTFATDALAGKRKTDGAVPEYPLQWPLHGEILQEGDRSIDRPLESRSLELSLNYRFGVEMRDAEPLRTADTSNRSIH